jgi:hypothetical protein
VSKNAATKAPGEKLDALHATVRDKVPDKTAGRPAVLRALCATMVIVDDRNNAAHPRPLDLERHEVAEHIAHAPRFLTTLLGLDALVRPFVSSPP